MAAPRFGKLHESLRDGFGRSLVAHCIKELAQ
jgi:hypothetical protein